MEASPLLRAHLRWAASGCLRAACRRSPGAAVVANVVDRHNCVGKTARTVAVHRQEACAKHRVGSGMLLAPRCCPTHLPTQTAPHRAASLHTHVMHSPPGSISSMTDCARGRARKHTARTRRAHLQSEVLTPPPPCLADVRALAWPGWTAPLPTCLRIYVVVDESIVLVVAVKAVATAGRVARRRLRRPGARAAGAGAGEEDGWRLWARLAPRLTQSVQLSRELSCPAVLAQARCLCMGPHVA